MDGSLLWRLKTLEKHKSFVKKIGGTFEDARKYAFNEYDRETRTRTVAEFLFGEERGLILDLGCSIGAWYPILKKLGFHEIVGTDLSPERLKIAHRRGMDVVLADGRYCPFRDEAFVATLCIDVLVHVLEEADQKKIIQEIFKVLKQDGPFVLSVPNKWSFEIKQKSARQQKVSYCTFFSLHEICEYLTTSEFTIEEVVGLCYLYPPWIRFITLGFSNMAIRVHLFLDYLLGSSRFKTLGHVFFIKAR